MPISRRQVMLLGGATGVGLMLPQLASAETLPAHPWLPVDGRLPLDGSGDLLGPGLDSDIGVAVPPSRDVAAILAQQNKPARVRALTALPLRFWTSGYRPQDAPADVLPWPPAASVSLTPDFPVDEHGVCMYPLGGKLYNHPVMQAQWALKMLSGYAATNRAVYLDSAVLHAQRIIDTHIESGGAWYLPYPFDFRLHGIATETMVAPWYSAMAQGEALALFTRLFNVTGESKWRTAADGLAASFMVPPRTESLPWTVHLDAGNYLWLEEYARWPHDVSDYTLNGHIFAIFGLYDYWRLTKDPNILRVFDGAVTTVRERAFVQLRHSNWISGYCVRHQTPNAGYHATHIRQFLNLTAMTGEQFFAASARRLGSDYPTPGMSGVVSFAGGRHVGYKFDNAGRITSSRTLNLSRGSSAPADQRIRIKTRGIYYRITAGGLAGFLVPESYPARRMNGIVDQLKHHPAARAYFQPGLVYTGYRLDAGGRVLGSKTARFSRVSSAPFVTQALVNGRTHVYVSAGAFAGHWVPTQDLPLQAYTARLTPKLG